MEDQVSTRATRLPSPFKATTAELKNLLEPVRLHISYPPSINALWRSVAGRSILSKTYRGWLKAAGMEVMIQRQRPIKGRVGIHVLLKAPDNRRRDLDNVGFKAIIDLLVKHGLIEGDDSRYVRALHAEWVTEGHPCTVIIKPAVF